MATSRYYAVVADSDPQLIVLLDAKFAELEEDAARNAQAYGYWRHRFERLHFVLGIPATVLAGVAGATAFAEQVPAFVVGTCAALAAGLAGVQTLARPDRRARFNHTQQIALGRLSIQARNFRELRLRSSPLEESQTKLENLYEEFHTVLSRSPD